MNSAMSPVRAQWVPPHSSTEVTRPSLYGAQHPIEVLAEGLGLTLESPEREKGVGTFKADILAEDDSGRPVVIECQLGKSDHDHLGKILTYMTNLECKKAIWITSDPRPEHIATFNWLNETTPLDTAFYLVKVEAVRIEDSPPAPMFSVVSGPSEETKEIGWKKAELAERHKKRLLFWEGLLEMAKGRTKLHSNLKPTKESWLSTGAGISGLSYQYLIGMDYHAVELNIDRGKGSEEWNKRMFNNLQAKKIEVERNFGESLIWDHAEGRRVCRVRWKSEGEGLKDESRWAEIQDRMIERMIKLEAALRPHIARLKEK